jgi:hypothetical protein
VRRLEQAGVPVQQAEVQAEVLTEAFNVNLDALVTKDYLAARFAEQNASIDTRFAEQKTEMLSGFAHLDAKIDRNFHIFCWTQSIVVAGVLLPFFERLL